MSTLTSPRLSPRPNSCNDLYKLSQKSPRLNESEKYEQSKILTNAAMNILNKLVLEAEDKPRTLLPSIFNKFGSISADHQYSPRLKKEVPNISRKTSSASCNDLANLSSKYVSTARDSHVTCGWLPRLEDDDVILANEEPVMLATVVELMTMIGQPEEKASNKSTLPHSQRSTKSSSQTPATPKKEEKPQVSIMAIFYLLYLCMFTGTHLCTHRYFYTSGVPLFCANHFLLLPTESTPTPRCFRLFECVGDDEHIR